MSDPPDLIDVRSQVSKYEATIESYKKKLEDLGDLRRQVKMLEEKNTDYMQINMELEENVKKTGNWRPQIDAYKKQGSLSLSLTCFLFQSFCLKTLWGNH